MKKTILFLCILCFQAKAQDLIYKKDKSVLMVSLIEIGPEDIKYREYGKSTSQVLTIKKSEVIKVKTERGKEILMEQNASASFDKRNAIKVGLLSYRLYHLTIAYERSLKPNRSIELGLGIIGIGTKPEDYESAAGVFTRIGYKIKRSPEFYTSKGGYGHLLKGGYLRPELTLGYIKQTLYQTVYSNGYYKFNKTLREQEFHYSTIILNAGKQWIIADDFLIDFFVGAGFGINTGDKQDVVFSSVGPPPVMFCSGIKVGILLR